MITIDICGEQFAVLQKIDRRLKNIKANFQNNTLYVICPKKLSRTALQALLLQNHPLLIAQWKLERLKTTQDMERYRDGGRFWFRGEILELKIINEIKQSNIMVYRRDHHLILTIPQKLELNPATLPLLKQAMTAWYKTEAYKYLIPRVDYFAQLIGATYNAVRLKNQKTCWGSCSAKGNINLNWRLIMAPENVSDYVIIHELCHLKYLNHSPEFWNLVKRHYPDYQNSRRWLKHNRQYLDL